MNEALNDPTKWDSNEPSPMAAVDLARFQAALVSIVGAEEDGTPHMRVVWGQDLKATAIWDRYAREWRPRYAHERIKSQVFNPATGLFETKYDWIGVPRFFIEAYIPPVHAKPAEEKAGVDADGDVFAEAKQPEGMWMTATPICQHSQLKVESGWRTCCYNAIWNKQTCWGTYREPDDFDLETVREGLERRMAANISRPDQRLTQYDREVAYLEWVRDALKEKNKKREEVEYRRRETMNTLKHWVDGVPGKLGRFSYTR